MAASANGYDRKMTCTNQIMFGPRAVPVRVGQILENSNMLSPITRHRDPMPPVQSKEQRKREEKKKKKDGVRYVPYRLRAE